MVNTQLLEYIKSQLAAGVSMDAIRNNLMAAAGWSETDIREAFSLLNSGTISNPPLVPQAVPMPPVKYAGFWIRFVAVIVDGIIISVPWGAIVLLISLLFSIGPATHSGVHMANDVSVGASRFLFQLGYYCVVTLYSTLMIYYKGATLGKMLVGITVKSDDFQRLSFGKALLRESVGKFISAVILYVGFIMAAFTNKKQALHDMLSHSVVVYKDPSKPRTAGLVIGIVIAAVLPAVAIVGLLTSVVLVSLDVARHKGFDSRIIATIISVRLAAEQYYSQNSNSYSHARSCTEGMFADPNIQQAVRVLSDKGALCYAEGSSYALSASLSDPTKSYCVDAGGFDGYGIAVDTGSAASCHGTDSMSGQTQ